MKGDVIIKWLVVSVAVVLLIFVGLIGYKNGWFEKVAEIFDTREKYQTSSEMPPVTQEKVSMVTDYYAKGLLKNIDSKKIILRIGDGDKTIEWKINAETKAGCLVDRVTNPSGQIERASNSYINYDKEMASLPNGNDVDWLLKQATINQPMIVFGDMNELNAKAIYLYADKCL